MRKVKNKLAMLLVALIIATVASFGMQLQSQPANAYSGSGYVLVTGSGGRYCWVWVHYFQSSNNNAAAGLVGYGNYTSAMACSVQPMNDQILVQFPQWPWAVVSNPLDVAYEFNTVSLPNNPGVQATGACARVQWWDNEWSSWGCISNGT